MLARDFGAGWNRPGKFLSFGRSGAGGGTPPIPAVDLESISSQSIRFPQSNSLDSSEIPGGAVIRLNNTTSIGRFLDPDNGGALYMVVDLPTETIYRPDSQVIGILGNTNSSSPIMADIKMGAPGQADNRILTFRFSGSGVEETITHKMVNKVPEATKLALIGVWTEYTADPAGNMYFGVWDMETGAQVVATESKAFTNFHGAALRTYQGIGGRVNYTTGAYHDTSNFPGGVKLFGLYDNGRVTAGPISEAHFDAIAAGENPVTVFGANKHLILRDWSDPSDLNTVPAGGEHALVTKANPLFEEVTAGGFSLMKGGTLKRQTAAQYLTFKPVRDGGVFPVLRGSTTGVFTMTGRTSLADGQGVQIRIYSTEDGTVALDWTTVATASGGEWAAIIACPLTKGWANYELRAASDPDNPNYHACYRRKMGVGYKLAIFGQSQMTILHQFIDPEVANWLDIEDADGAALSVSRIGNPNTSVAFPYTVIADASSYEYSNGVLGMAKYFRSVTTAPFELIVHAEPGTSQADLMDDTHTTRSWATSQMLSAFTGPQFTAVVEQWITAIAAYWSGVYQSQILDEWILGKSVGTPTYTSGLDTYTRHHSMFGNANDPSVIDPEFGAAVLLFEGTRTAISVDPGARFDQSEPGGIYSNLSQHRNIRLAQRAFIAANENVYAGIPAVDHYLGAGGGHHQDDGSPYGQLRLAIRMAQSICHGLGLQNLTPPEIAGATVSGSRIIVTFDMKGHGDLTVDTDLTGVTTPDGYPALSGWEVDEGSGFSLIGFTASIISANQVALDKDGGAAWTGLPTVQLGYGGPYTRDAGTDREVHGCLLADIGVDTSTNYGKAWAGIPVLSPASVVAVAA